MAGSAEAWLREEMLDRLTIPLGMADCRRGLRSGSAAQRLVRFADWWSDSGGLLARGLRVADQWYYWHESEIRGPFSGKQLAALAAAGDIIPTDTVWKDGVEDGVQASRVQHLFAPTLVTPDGGTDGEPAATEPTPAAVPVAGEPPSRWDAVRQSTSGRARASAGPGALIVGQDGKTVKFRKKCTTCGYEDSSWKTMPITRGTTRVAFFCPKCRKQRHAEVHGHTS